MGGPAGMPPARIGTVKQSDSPLPYRVTRGGAAYDALDRLPVSVVLADVRSAYNVGAFFRTAEAVRCDHLYLAGISPPPTHRGRGEDGAGRGSARGVERRGGSDRARGSARSTPACASLRSRRPLIAEDLFDWSPSFPVCILFGNEVDGLPAELLERATDRVRVPMLGFKQSLNVATAGGVVLYELLRKYRAHPSSFRFDHQSSAPFDDRG